MNGQIKLDYMECNYIMNTIVRYYLRIPKSSSTTLPWLALRAKKYGIWVFTKNSLSRQSYRIQYRIIFQIELY